MSHSIIHWLLTHNFRWMGLSLNFHSKTNGGTSQQWNRRSICKRGVAFKGMNSKWDYIHCVFGWIWYSFHIPVCWTNSFMLSQLFFWTSSLPRFNSKPHTSDEQSCVQPNSHSVQQSIPSISEHLVSSICRQCSWHFPISNPCMYAAPNCQVVYRPTHFPMTEEASGRKKKTARLIGWNLWEKEKVVRILNCWRKVERSVILNCSRKVEWSRHR